MLQLRSENQRMQQTMSQNGLEEVQASPPDDDTEFYKKKLSIGNPTTFGESFSKHLGVIY